MKGGPRCRRSYPAELVAAVVSRRTRTPLDESNRCADIGGDLGLDVNDVMAICNFYVPTNREIVSQLRSRAAQRRNSAKLAEPMTEAEIRTNSEIALESYRKRKAAEACAPSFDESFRRIFCEPWVPS